MAVSRDTIKTEGLGYLLRSIGEDFAEEDKKATFEKNNPEKD